MEDDHSKKCEIYKLQFKGRFFMAKISGDVRDDEFIGTSTTAFLATQETTLLMVQKGKIRSKAAKMTTY